MTNPMSGEFKNRFSNAKIVAVDANPDAYHATKGERGKPDFIMSRSELTSFAECPQRWLRGYNEDSTKSTEFGELFDCMVLSGQHFDERFAISPEKYPDSKTGELKDWTFAANYCKDWKRNQGNRKIVKHGAHADAQSAAARLLGDPVNAEFLQCCARQVFVMGEYEDRETGLVVPVKALLDLAPDKNHPLYHACLADLKTSTSASEKDWSKFVTDRTYYVQAALYQDLYNAATGEHRNTFLHLIVENYSPWEYARSWVTEEFIELGRMVYLNALRDYCQCLATGQWPGYNRGEASLPGLPGWRKCEPPLWLVNQIAA